MQSAHWLRSGIWVSASSFQQKVLTTECFVQSSGSIFATLLLHQHAYSEVWHYWPQMLSNWMQCKAAGLYLFVEWPDFIPLHVDHRPRSTLCEDRKYKEIKTKHTNTAKNAHLHTWWHTWAAMNCLSPSTVIPLRSTPLTVGNRGSSLGERQTPSSVLHNKS